jgi:hypothetical protein
MQTLELASSSRSTTRQEDETIWRAQDKLLKRFLCAVLQNSLERREEKIKRREQVLLLLSSTARREKTDAGRVYCNWKSFS